MTICLIVFNGTLSNWHVCKQIIHSHICWACTRYKAHGVCSLEAQTVISLSSRRAPSDRGEMRCTQSSITEGGQRKGHLSLILGGTLNFWVSVLVYFFLCRSSAYFCGGLVKEHQPFSPHIWICFSAPFTVMSSHAVSARLLFADEGSVRSSVQSTFNSHALIYTTVS